MVAWSLGGQAADVERPHVGCCLGSAPHPARIDHMAARAVARHPLIIFTPAGDGVFSCIENVRFRASPDSSFNLHRKSGLRIPMHPITTIQVFVT